MRQTETKLARFRVPSQLRCSCCRQTQTRDVGGYGLATGKSGCHFITEVSGAIGRKQELLEKCIQGKAVPFLRKGTTFWPSPGAWGIAWLAGGAGTGLAPRNLLAAGMCDPPGFWL